MPEQSPQPPKSLSEQLTDALIKLLVTGSGASSLIFLFKEDIPKALIAGAVAAGAGLLTSFGEGLMETLKSSFRSRGKKTGEAIDKGIDQTVSSIWDKFSDFPKKYQEALKAQCYAVEIEGFQDLPGLALADVFVPLRIESEQSRLTSEGARPIWYFLPQPHQVPSQFIYRRIAVLGAPGYGKTTLLRHLTFTYVTAPPADTRPFIPILLRFREIHPLIQKIRKEQEAEGEEFLNLPGLIAKHLENQPEFKNLSSSSQWFEERLNHGQCLVMLDGLDEVPKAQRQKVRQWVNSQMKTYQKTQFILTSRPYGFELQPDEPSHPIQVELKLRVLDFTPDQKQEFIEKWYRTVFWRVKWGPLLNRSHQEPEAAHLGLEQARAKSDQEAKDSASNLLRQIFNAPALNDLARNPLLITMIAATHRANTELPKRRVELYEKICSLLLGTRPYAKGTTLTLTASENKFVLQVLAWNLVQREITQFTPEQGTAWIQDALARCRKDRSLTPEEFWHEMTDIAGLLVEKELGKYEFTHQTFQEYFAALHLKEMGSSGEEKLLEKLANDRWQEVICFYAALGNAAPLIDAALNHPTPYTLKLAQRCKNEGREVEPQTLDRLNQMLLQASLEDGALTAEVRLEQRFHDLVPIDDQTAISEPITWGEYLLFLEAQASGQFHSTAEVLQVPSEQDNQPVTGISWEDARWFCAWLATQASLQSEDVLYDYRLPTSEEMEKAVRKGITENPAHSGDFLRVVRVQLPNRYRALLNYLANGRWREADEETAKVMLEVAGKKEQGYLDEEDIEKFPCEDLRILDQLWKKFSGSLFGFSVQKEIYRSLGGTKKYDKQSWTAFCERVGWKTGETWVSYPQDLNFSLEAPKGHLPFDILGYKYNVVLLSRQDL